MENKLFNFRLSIELMEAVKAKAGKTSMTDVITSLLSDWLAGPVAPLTTSPNPRIAELEAENARLRRDQQTAVAKAALSPGQAETVVGRHRHLGNPLQPTTGLPVGGMAIGFNLKGGSNAHGDKKSGR